MSNTRHIRERNAGKLTRPRARWKARRRRGMVRSPYASQMNAAAAPIIRSIFTSMAQRRQGQRNG